MEIMPYIEHASSIRINVRQYNGLTYYNGTKQIFFEIPKNENKMVLSKMEGSACGSQKACSKTSIG